MLTAAHLAALADSAAIPPTALRPSPALQAMYWGRLTLTQGACNRGRAAIRPSQAI